MKTLHWLVNHHEAKKRSGSALTTVVVIIASVTALAAVIATIGSQRVYTARLRANETRALAIAEAGANNAYSVLATNWAARTNPAAFPPTPYSDGMYAVRVQPVSNNYAIITSTGTCGRAVQWVMLDAVNYTEGTQGTDDDAFNYAILCGGTFTFRGAGNISGGDGRPRLHSNSSLDIRGSCGVNLDIQSSTKISIGNNITINGSVKAPVLDYRPSKVTITGGATVGPVPHVTIPDIDLTPYYNWALAHGEVKNGFSLSGGTYNANGGIIWVNGDVHISGHAVVNGSIIATGHIHISGQADINQTGFGFALASRDGSIQYTSSGTTRGLIYAKTGDFRQTANGRIEGQLIIKGTIYKGGCSDVVVFSKTVLTPPYGGDQGDIVGISAWQR
ncbi:MAG: hypothetical protein ACUVWX_12700 [Kiritimatiellia bacterium]